MIIIAVINLAINYSNSNSYFSYGYMIGERLNCEEGGQYFAPIEDHCQFFYRNHRG